MEKWEYSCSIDLVLFTTLNMTQDVSVKKFTCIAFTLLSLRNRNLNNYLQEWALTF